MMKRTWCTWVFSLALLCVPAGGWAKESWSPEEQQMLASIERLSASTAMGGAGADAYGAILADDFSRWTVGGAVINDKHAWVEGVRAWFDDGWRVSARKTRQIEIQVKDAFAFTRRVVEETYRDPEGENATATAALAEVWIREGADWRLLRVNVHPMDNS